MANTKPGKPSGAKKQVVPVTSKRHRSPKVDQKPSKDTEVQPGTAKDKVWKLVVGPTGSKRMRLM